MYSIKSIFFRQKSEKTCLTNWHFSTVFRTAHLRHHYKKTTILSCHRCLINAGAEKNEQQIESAEVLPICFNTSYWCVCSSQSVAQNIRPSWNFFQETKHFWLFVLNFGAKEKMLFNVCLRSVTWPTTSDHLQEPIPSPLDVSCHNIGPTILSMTIKYVTLSIMTHHANDECLSS
jgi:hypothetical protein